MQEFQVLRVLEPAVRMKAQTLLTAEVRNILFVDNLFVEKRGETLHVGECRGSRNSRESGWGVGFIAFFLHYLRAEMPFRCKWAFPREEKCLLDLPLSVLHTCQV
jgi:hypothetical protein